MLQYLTNQQSKKTLDEIFGKESAKVILDLKKLCHPFLISLQGVFQNQQSINELGVIFSRKNINDLTLQDVFATVQENINNNNYITILGILGKIVRHRKDQSKVELSQYIAEEKQATAKNLMSNDNNWIKILNDLSDLVHLGTKIDNVSIMVRENTEKNK